MEGGLPGRHDDSAGAHIVVAARLRGPAVSSISTRRGWLIPITRQRLGIALLNLAASIHIVWFYLAYVPSELNLPRYERGLERTPFQGRLLMMFPLRFAHSSPWINRLAVRLTAMPAWFPHGVRPEGLVEAAIDLACVLVTGLIARSLYESASHRKLLGPYVYPLTLLMIAATFCMNTMHRIRLVFDLPSMAFFAIGLAIIYYRRSVFLLAAVFCIGTVNRETTLFLLMLFLITRWVDAAPGLPLPAKLAKIFDPRTSLVLVSLTAFWLLWHRFVSQHFVGNPTAAGPRFWLNVGTLLWPTSWAQILCTFAFCWPLCLAGRGLLRDATLRAWYWLLPIWIVFMMRFGILIETRIFGELIPFLACTATLLAEEHVLRRLSAQQHRSTERQASAV